MKKNIAFLVLIILLCSSSIFNKNYFTELVDNKLKEYSTNFAPEKIFVHTDKPYYTIDDTIWYSSYLVDGITHEKSKKSWVIHVELFDNNDSLVSKRKLFTNNLSAGGDFKIEKSWKPGNYLLRAYTNYMKNNDENYFFKKEIKVFDIDSAYKTKTIENKNISLGNDKYKQIKPELEFYPEGGNLVENLRSKVAIKVKNIGLSDITFSGIIVNDKDEVISDFKTAQFGTGVFTISPKPNVKYFAKLQVNDVEYSYKLPKANAEGYTLGAINTGNKIIVNVASKKTTGLAQTYLVAHQRGKQIMSKFQETPINTYTINIPTNTIKDGVMHLTLFDSEGRPTCERLVFISNTNNIGKIEITTNKKTLGNRKEQTINIVSKDNKENVLPSFLSMTVLDLNIFPYNRFNKNIKTYLLLNSDLRGEIKDPGYFFDGEFTPKKQYLLDLIMLTNGWRRFTWQNLLYTKKTTEFNPEKGINISGQIKHLKKPFGPVSAPTRLTFYTKNGITQEPEKQSNSKGYFEFGPFIFYDSIQTIIESRLTNFKSDKNSDRKVAILINNDEVQTKINKNNTFKEENSKEIQLENYLKISKYIKKINDGITQKRQQLEEVTIIAQKESEEEKRNAQLNDLTDYAFPTRRLDVQKEFEESGLTVLDMLNFIPGVIADNNSISIRNGGDPVILLDKFSVNIDFIQSLQASEVSFIDVLLGADAAIYSNSGNGVIAIYSRTGNISSSRNIRRRPGIIDFKVEGFYSAKEFYSPNYASDFETFNPDLRTTLHWESRIAIESQFGKDVSFYTSDSDGDYLIEVQGISSTGIPLYATSTFSVE